MTEILEHRLDLSGVRFANTQVWGTVRLVPLLRETAVPGLQLHRQVVDAFADVTLRGAVADPTESYLSYVPHALVASLADEGPVAAYGTKLRKASAKLGKKRGGWMRLHRMARLEEGNLRFLPLHLAMEGYLDLHFGGPDVAWEEYSRDALARGLSPRLESGVSGHLLPGLADALRVFEIHEDQVGVALFIGDVFTSIFIAPNAADYRVLHPTLLTDFFGDTIWWNALGYPEVPEWDTDLKAAGDIHSIADIRAALSAREAEWASFHRDLTRGLFEAPVRVQQVQKLGRFRLQRSMPTFRLDAENHIGEFIVDEQGQVAYMKSFLLTQAQVRRGHLLSLLHAADWNIEEAAKSIADSSANLLRRIEKNGFGYLLKSHVREQLRVRR